MSLVRSTIFALPVAAVVPGATPVLAQSASPSPAQFGANSEGVVGPDGTLIIPGSSITRLTDAGITAHTNVEIFVPNGFNPAIGPPVTGYFYNTPASVACIYQLVSPSAGCDPNKVTANPAGGSKTIAIVDAYDAPNIASDLAKFDAQFGVSAPPSFQVVYASGSKPASNAGWETEISLDVEWAHAMAPSANIILVEAASSSVNDLLAAVDKANQLASSDGVSEISMSWGSGDFSGETAYDNHFAAANVVYFGATGDSKIPEWPALSSRIVGVGGTTIQRDTNGVLSGEAAWIDTGAGPSAYVALPPYQNPVAHIIGSNHRAIADVAALADPQTGVWVYDTTAGGWLIVGGTSVATPVFAAIVNNSGHFNSSGTNELSEIYQNLGNSADFNDVTAGVCGSTGQYNAVAGWDFCTGVGTSKGRNGK